MLEITNPPRRHAAGWPQMSERRCRNPGCDCRATRSSEYCSAACARSANGGIPSAPCDCGHRNCAGGIVESSR